MLGPKGKERRGSSPRTGKNGRSPVRAENPSEEGNRQSGEKGRLDPVIDPDPEPMHRSARQTEGLERGETREHGRLLLPEQKHDSIRVFFCIPYPDVRHRGKNASE